MRMMVRAFKRDSFGGSVSSLGRACAKAESMRRAIFRMKNSPAEYCLQRLCAIQKPRRIARIKLLQAPYGWASAQWIAQVSTGSVTGRATVILVWIGGLQARERLSVGRSHHHNQGD